VSCGGVRAVLLTQWRRSRTLYNLNKLRNNYTNLDSSSASQFMSYSQIRR